MKYKVKHLHEKGMTANTEGMKKLENKIKITKLMELKNLSILR